MEREKMPLPWDASGATKSTTGVTAPDIATVTCGPGNTVTEITWQNPRRQQWRFCANMVFRRDQRGMQFAARAVAWIRFIT
jgi:hypothetical protein